MRETRVLSKHPTQREINLPGQSHFQNASPNPVSLRSTLSTFLPTHSCGRQFLLGYQHTTTFSACKKRQRFAKLKLTPCSHHMIFDLASECILRSIHIWRRLQLTMSRIPENLFAISSQAPSQPYGFQESRSIQFLPSPPAFHSSMDEFAHFSFSSSYFFKFSPIYASESNPNKVSSSCWLVLSSSLGAACP